MKVIPLEKRKTELKSKFITLNIHLLHFIGSLSTNYLISNDHGSVGKSTGELSHKYFKLKKICAYCRKFGKVRNTQKRDFLKNILYIKLPSYFLH